MQNLILIISSVRNLRSELNIPYKEFIEINFSNNNQEFVRFLNKYIEELKNLLKLKKISFDSITKKILGAAYIVVGDTTLIIPLKGVIDTKKEIIKLHSKKNIEVKKLDNINSKLTNSSFMLKASNKIKEKFIEDANKIKSSIEKIDQIIDTIK